MKKITIILIVVAFLGLTTMCIKTFGQSLKPYKAETMNGIKWGYIDIYTEQKTIPAKYDKALPFTENLGLVMANGKVAYIDSTGKEIIPFKYVTGTPFVEGIAFVSKDGNKFGLIDKKGFEHGQFIYDDIQDFSDGLALVVIGGKVGFINKEGVQIVPCKYFFAESFRGGVAKVILSNTSSESWKYTTTTGFINTQGVEVVKPIYYNYETYNIGNGFVVVCKRNAHQSDQYGIVDKTGKFIYELDYNIQSKDDIECYEKYIKIRSKNYCSNLNYCEGIIDYTGKLIIPISFKEITAFNFGANKEYAKVFFPSGNFFYVDRTYKCIEYDNVKCPE